MSKRSWIIIGATIFVFFLFVDVSGFVKVSVKDKSTGQPISNIAIERHISGMSATVQGGMGAIFDSSVQTTNKDGVAIFWPVMNFQIPLLHNVTGDSVKLGDQAGLADRFVAVPDKKSGFGRHLPYRAVSLEMTPVSADAGECKDNACLKANAALLAITEMDEKYCAYLINDIRDCHEDKECFDTFLKVMPLGEDARSWCYFFLGVAKSDPTICRQAGNDRGMLEKNCLEDIETKDKTKTLAYKELQRRKGGFGDYATVVEYSDIWINACEKAILSAAKPKITNDWNKCGVEFYGDSINYCGTALDGIDKNSFKQLNKAYATDADGVYWFNGISHVPNPLPFVDLDDFTALNAYFGKDTKRVYAGDKILDDIDAETFQIANIEGIPTGMCGQDKNGTYSHPYLSEDLEGNQVGPGCTRLIIGQPLKKPTPYN